MQQPAKKMEPSEYEDLVRHDVIAMAAPLFEKGWFVGLNGKITCIPRIEHNLPWIFIKKHEQHNCGMWHKIYFETFKIIHSGCLSCHKVVVEPKNVKQLFKLHDLMIRLNYPSKCGVDLRPYTNSQYAGYFYCWSQEEVEAREKKVKPLVKKYVGQTTKVWSKRYCTEFENKWGTEGYQPPDHKKWEKIVDESFEIPPEALGTHDQPEIVKKHVKRMWLDIAAFHYKDETARQFHHGQPLSTLYPAGLSEPQHILME
jgi:hypothetical protein